MADVPVGPYQIPRIASDDPVARVSHSEALANAINSALGTVAGTVTDLGPAWAVTGRSVPANGDLDTYLVPGLSRIRTPDTATIAHLPGGMRSAGMLNNVRTADGTDTIVAQIVTENGDGGRIHWRSPNESGVLSGPWSLMGEPNGPVTEWHVFLAVGQSNMSGRGAVSTAEGGRYVSKRIYQFGFTRRVHEMATVPLDMHDTSSGLSPATTFARTYLRSQGPHVGVLIVPAAHGSTGFTTSTTTQTWTPNVATNPAYDLPGSAVTQTLDAITAAKATGAAVVLKGVLWHQGENNGSMSTSTYATNLDALIAYFRTQLSAPNLPFLVGQMVPEGITANAPGRVGIDLAHQQTPGRVPYTAFAPSTTGGYNPGDTTHMSRLGVDFLGGTYAEAFRRAVLNDAAPLKWSEAAGRTVSALNPATGVDQLLFGDTGWRVAETLLTNLASGKIYLRRFGARVSLDFQAAVFTDPAGNITLTGLLPAGFTPTRTTNLLILETTPGTNQRRINVGSTGNLVIVGATAGQSFSSLIQFDTTAAWPASLPGVAAGSIPV